MARRRGLQAEILASFALVMITATAVLGLLLVRTHERQAELLQRLAGRALFEDAGRPLPLTAAATPELRWWSIPDAAPARAHGSHAQPLDPETAALAEIARSEGRALMRAGRPWEPLHFASPLGGEVRVARLAPAVSVGWLLALVVADVAVFTAFGLALLRRRLVRPLQRLDAAARAIAEGDHGVRAPADGPRETFEVANAFNAMIEAVESRSQALEKAVRDLRRSNRELCEAREGLDRAERLAAVGSLAAGVAHEVGNPMGAVLAFVDLARRDAGLSEPSRDHLGRALEEGERVRRILRQLLDFSRPPRADRTAFELLALAEETAGLVRAQRRYAGVEIEVVGEAVPPPAFADRGQVGQILLNLLLNAADAVAGVAGAAVRVRVRPAVGTTRSGDSPGGVLPHRSRPDAVECTVEDNGPGVALEHRDRIFDPFFSTKGVGQATGLGLSNALRLAEELGGRLTLESTEGPGARFRLVLPVAGREEGGAVRS